MESLGMPCRGKWRVLAVLVLSYGTFMAMVDADSARVVSLPWQRRQALGLLRASSQQIGTHHRHTLAWRSKQGRTRLSGFRRTAGPGQCNITVGKWRRINRIAPYSRECPFLKRLGHVNCFKFTSSKLAQGLTWLPNKCPGGIRFNPVRFLIAMRNRVLAAVGDSVILDDLVPSLLCQIWQVTTVVPIADASKYTSNGFAWSVPRFNTVIVAVWSAFLVQHSQDASVVRRYASSSNPAEDAAIDVHSLDPAWASHIGLYDVVLVHTAAHWAPRYLHAVRVFVDASGNEINPQPHLFDAYVSALSTVRQFLESKAQSSSKSPIYLFMTAPLRMNGCKNWKGQLLSRKEVATLTRTNLVWQFFYPAQRRVFERSERVGLLEITGPSMFRVDALVGTVRGDNDCTHWCLPGVPDTWVDALGHKLLPKAAESWH